MIAVERLTIEQAAAALERAQTLADRAAARVFRGEVASPAYAQRLARELEEAQADYDFATGERG